MSRKLQIDELGRLSREAFEQAEKIPVAVLLDDVRSMHNVGAVFRTADAFRLERIVLGGITPRPPHRDITKTAIGAELTVPWLGTEDALDTCREYRRAGYRLLALEQTESSCILSDFQALPAEKYLLILGHEIHGVRQEILDLVDVCLEIPQFGTKHSLNVSVAAGIALHHLAMPFWRSSATFFPTLPSSTPSL